MTDIVYLIELDPRIPNLYGLFIYKLAQKGVSLIMFSKRHFLAKKEIMLELEKNTPRKEFNLAKDFEET